MLKPYSFLLYLLAFITSFFMGMTFAGIVEAGKNQGLAGGAIVFGYGIIAAVTGLIAGLIISNKANRKFIFRLNIILALWGAGFYLYFQVKYFDRQKERNQEDHIQEMPRKEKRIRIYGTQVKGDHSSSESLERVIDSYCPMQNLDN